MIFIAMNSDAGIAPTLFLQLHCNCVIVMLFSNLSKFDKQNTLKKIDKKYATAALDQF